MKKRIYTKGGGIYRVSGTGKLTVVETSATFFDSGKTIGTVSSLEDAIALIRAYSGKEIKEIKEA